MTNHPRKNPPLEQPMPSRAPKRILRLPEVCRTVGLSRSGVYAKIQAGGGVA